MKVKKYRAKSIREATGKVREVLGPDAMILSTKRLKGSHHRFEIAALASGGDISGRGEDLFGEVKSELMSIKEMIYLLNHSGGIMEQLMTKPEVFNLYARLIRSGVHESHTRMFLERAGAFNGPPLNGLKGIREKAVFEMMRSIDVRAPFETGDDRRIVAAFIGTTGVGKTTTVAKLAAQLMLEDAKKVGLISIDTYRIGAMEQLKTYANILGIPCFQAFTRKDLLFALRRMDGRDVILIDTAGQSQYDKSRIDELNKMMSEDLAISTHLLLSVPTTESEMNRTAINFGPLKFQSYIFTKVDETERCGPIINQVMNLNLPISYLTTGQNVPEDIEKADKKKIIDLLLRRPSNI